MLTASAYYAQVYELLCTNHHQWLRFADAYGRYCAEFNKESNNA